MRCPTPHSGALRNSLPPAAPCETLSASPCPMSCSAKSLNGWNVLLLCPVKAELPVVWLTAVAERAADVGEDLAAAREGRVDRRRLRRVGEARERREADDVGDRRHGAGARIDLGAILRQAVELAAAVGLALVGEDLVGHALLDVVGLAGEDQQRLVLRLPAEPGDRAVVAAVVEPPGDAELRLLEARLRERSSPARRPACPRPARRRTSAWECGR